MKSKYIAIVFFILLSLFVYLVSVIVPAEELHKVINNVGIFGPIVYILLMFLTYVVAPLSGTPVTYAGYYAYGQKVIIYNVIATYLSYFVNFYIARRWGRSIVKKLVGKDNMEKVDILTKNYGIATLAFMRLFQGSVHDFVSFAAGLTNMKFVPYIVVSFIASIPATIIWYLLSFYTKTPAQFVILMLAIAAIFSAIFVVGSAALKTFKKRRLKLKDSQ